MALTGLQINKLLPGTNCKECGSNTCLAFAMKLAARKAQITECPYASEEAHRILFEATEPPVRAVYFGPNKKFVVGEETVLYRHEKAFVHPPRIGLHILETDSDMLFEEKLDAAVNYTYHRVGEEFGIDCIALTCEKNNDLFVNRAETVWNRCNKPLVLNCNDVNSVLRVCEKIANSGSILCCSIENCDQFIEIAQKYNFALSLHVNTLDELFTKVTEMRNRGFFQIFLQFTTYSLSEHFLTNTIVRSAAIKYGIKSLGFPFLRFVQSGDIWESAIESITEILKYGGIIILPNFDPALLASLFTLRMNAYSDPQKPIQVDPNIYLIGDPTKNSPVFVTTNFSLTYFVVSGEIENSGISAYLVVPECEGMSVLTAWAAGKFTAPKIASFINEKKLTDMLETKRLIIPGYVAQISGELSELLPEWDILVGPQEASDIESFVKSRLL
ncbi:MAG: acetyl-CoA decarbonylase/synthase complex subunit gamma [Spirochaetes bacterium]|nr:acetyl-CoA decarbonylase/synthase complex subunit gamma [Spirochaetota bacterium]